MIDFATRRPIRPKPLIPTLIFAISIFALFFQICCLSAV